MDVVVCVVTIALRAELGLRLLDGHFLDDVAVLVDLLTIDALGRAVELRVAEQRSCAGVVDDVERQLVLVREEPGAPADHLLERRHRADGPEQHDVADSRQIDASGQHLRGRGDDRDVLLGVGEVAEVTAADLMLVADDAHHVVRVLLGEFGVGIVERSTHFAGVLLVDAEHDRLGEGVSPLQVLREVLRRCVGS